jgi:hypothetical protein
MTNMFVRPSALLKRCDSADAPARSRNVVFYAGCTPVTAPRVNGGVVLCESPKTGVSVLMGLPAEDLVFGRAFEPRDADPLGAFPVTTGRLLSQRASDRLFREAVRKGNGDAASAARAFPGSVHIEWAGGEGATHPLLDSGMFRARDHRFRRIECALGYDPLAGAAELLPVCILMAPPLDRPTHSAHESDDDDDDDDDDDEGILFD